MTAQAERPAVAPPAFAILKPPLLHAVTGRTIPADAAARRLRRARPASVTTKHPRRRAARTVRP